jgi:L,D-peptidoglycan transpeptidase YkuD (ErfK/YbiS/YcfS/YnhG family)
MKILFLALLVVPIAAIAQVKRPEPQPAKPSFSTSLQAIVVTTADWPSVQGTARLYERKNARAAWKQVGAELPVVVGRGGLGLDGSGQWREDAEAPHKKEGDGRSPAGIIPLAYAFGRPQKAAGTKLQYRRLAESTECVDDVNSTHYNRIVDRYQVGNFDWNSSEKMLEVGDQYDLGVFVAYNSYPAVRGNGSCIFLHVWKDAETGTSGCTAMSHENIEKVLKWLDPAKNPHLIQLPTQVYSIYQKQLKLPKL